MIILVTGATAGFGKAISRKLVAEGHKVIGNGRRLEKLQELQAELGETNFYPLPFDVTNRKQIQTALANLPEVWQQIDVLVNNAGLALGLEPAFKANLDDWETMIQTNCLGLATMTRLILPQMVHRRSGYIINLGSIAGNYTYPGSSIYGATKAFVQQFTMNLRTDLVGSGIRVTNVMPGLCGGTEFSHVRFKGDNERATKVYENIAYITPEDIANIISFLVSQPEHVNINFLEVMPTAQACAGLKVLPKNFEFQE